MSSITRICFFPTLYSPCLHIYTVFLSFLLPTMGNCLRLPPSPPDFSVSMKALPVETAFKLPSPIPTWPKGGGFANGTIDLGGLQVRQISTFTKIWAVHDGGQGNAGAAFFEPSPVPEGFFMLGSYSQPNNSPLFGWVLVGKDNAGNALKPPIDYTLVWSSESLKIKKDGDGYIWLPTPPDGYKAVGLVITPSPKKPSLDKIRCVRSDLTDTAEGDASIWEQGNFNVLGLRPSVRGTQAKGVPVGTFWAQNGAGAAAAATMACLKNTKPHIDSMPNLNQIQALFQAYSPFVYLHPDEAYLPSSVTWFFNNGALLYKRGEESKPVSIDSTGSNLPQDGSNDGAYWLDLPVDGSARERVKKGDLGSSQVYLHVKPMLGATFTDIAVWVFYPFNGPATAKVEFINIPLGKIGEHVGDWEHVTLRISNFNGELKSVYFSEHSAGIWVQAPGLQFQDSNKPVAYSSLHGHAFYPRPGLVIQGTKRIGIRNDTEKSDKFLDTGGKGVVVAAEYLGVAEPPWVNYLREWGPKIEYNIADEIGKVEKKLPGKLKSAFEKVVRSLPSEVLGEEGPTGPKGKNNWDGDEVVKS